MVYVHEEFGELFSFSGISTYINEGCWIHKFSDVVAINPALKEITCEFEDVYACFGFFDLDENSFDINFFGRAEGDDFVEAICNFYIKDGRIS